MVGKLSGKILCSCEEAEVTTHWRTLFGLGKSATKILIPSQKLCPPRQSLVVMVIALMQNAKFLLAVFTLSQANTTSADVYYVGNKGNQTNNGAPLEPFPSVEFALSKVGGGNTIIVHTGLYSNPIIVERQFSGTAERPTIIKSSSKWKAAFYGAPYHDINVRAEYVVIDGFELAGARYSGIKVEGDHCVVTNCWIHNNAIMGIEMHNRRDSVISANLIEFNGSHIHLHHGIYASGEGFTVHGNVVRHNAGFGIHMYPSVKMSEVSCNLIYGHAYKAGIILDCPVGGGNNRVINNTIVDNHCAITIWQGYGETIANNILAGQPQAVVLDSFTSNVVMESNLFVSGKHPIGDKNIVGDPKFVDSDHGNYNLALGSPAIGAGHAGYAPRFDFWGCPITNTAALDIGGFAGDDAPFRRGSSAKKPVWLYRATPQETSNCDYWVK